MIQFKRRSARPRFRDLSPIEQRFLLELVRGGDRAAIVRNVGMDDELYLPTVDALCDKLSIRTSCHALMWILTQSDASASLYGPQGPLSPSVRLQKIRPEPTCTIVDVDIWSMLPNTLSSEGSERPDIPTLAS